MLALEVSPKIRREPHFAPIDVSDNSRSARCKGATLHSGNAQRVCPDDLHDRKSISIFAGVSIPRNGATTAWILDDRIGYLSD